MNIKKMHTIQAQGLACIWQMKSSSTYHYKKADLVETECSEINLFYIYISVALFLSTAYQQRKLEKKGRRANEKRMLKSFNCFTPASIDCIVKQITPAKLHVHCLSVTTHE